MHFWLSFYTLYYVHTEITEFDKVKVEEPEESFILPQLFSRTTLTCKAAGIPQPNITWFKDGEVLPGEMSNTLIIQEMDLTNRGHYSCSAANFDPKEAFSSDNFFVEASQEVIVNIEGT